MAISFNKKTPNIPTEPRALKRLERYIELGEFEDVPVPGIPNIPRYLTMSSRSRLAA